MNFQSEALVRSQGRICYCASGQDNRNLYGTRYRHREPKQVRRTECALPLLTYHITSVPLRLSLPLSRTLGALPKILLQQTSKLDVKLLKLLDLSDMMPQNSWSCTTVSDITVAIFLNPTHTRLPAMGCYITKYGQPTRDSTFIRWEIKANSFLHRPPNILLFSSEFIEIRDAQSGLLKQVIEAVDIRLLIQAPLSHGPLFVGMRGHKDDEDGLSDRIVELIETAEISAKTPISGPFKAEGMWDEWDNM